MSIKTSKRIALGVIASLVFAPFAAIAPASAALGAGVIATPSNINLLVGQTAVVPVVVTSVAADAGNAETFTVTPTADGSSISFSASRVDLSQGGMNVIDANSTNGFAITSSGVGAITVLGTGDESDATKAKIDTKTIGSIVFSAAAPGQYTVTLTTTGDLTATAKTFKVFVSPSTSASFAATTLADGTNGSIYKVSADTPTIMVTRPTGQPTSAGDIALEVVSAPEVVKFPVGAVIRSGDLTPGAGVTLTSIASGFGTSFTFPALADRGLYQFKAFVDANNNNLRDASEASADVEFRVVGIPTKAVVALDSSSTVNGAVNKTFNATVTLTDVGGYATYGSAVPTFTITSKVTATGVAGAAAATDDVAAAGAVRIGTTNTYRAAIARTGTNDSNDHTFTITPVCAGTACTTNTAATFVVSGATLAATITKVALASAEGIYFGTAGAASYTTVIPADETADNTLNTGMVAVTADPAVTTFSFTVTGTAAKSYAVTTTAGANTALSRISAPTSVTTLADGKVTFTVTVTTPTVTTTTADSFTINVAGTTNNNFGYTVTYAKPAALWTLTPATAPDVLEGSTNTVKAKLTDTYGRVLGSTAYTVQVTGRNVSAATGVTDASGMAEYTVTDSAKTSYTDYPSDTVTFTNVGTTALPAVNGAVSFNYEATLAAVGSVTVTVAAGNVTVDQVEVLPGSPNASTADYTATVRTAAGASVGAGTLVTFAGGADDLFVDGVNSGVTNASGQVTVTVYRQKIGNALITATANSVTGSAVAKRWVINNGDRPSNGDAGADDNTAARNVKVSAAQTITPGSAATVVATVTDRWGNPVSGVLVTWSTSGVGRAILGADTTVGTDANGNAQFQVTSLATETGVMTVTALVTGTDQTADLAGFVAGTAVAGVTAGNDDASTTVTFATAPVVTPEVVVPQVAPTLQGSLNGRVLLFGSCMADEGDMIIYVKSPGKAWNEKAKTLECVAGEFDGSIRAPKNNKFYRVKQEGTGLWSTSVLIRP